MNLTNNYCRKCVIIELVNMQFRELENYIEIEGINQDESYLPRIFRPSSLNGILIITFTLHFDVELSSIIMALNERHELDVLIVDVLIVMSQWRCREALSQSHAVMHDNTTLDWFTAVCHDILQWKQWQSCREDKNFKNTHKARPSILNSLTNLLMKILRN